MKKKVVRESCGRRMAVWSLAAMMLLGSMGMQAQGTVGVLQGEGGNGCRSATGC